MKFFVARVNLAEQAKTGFRMLRPLQFAYESEKFMLPIRLGMANANGPQDLIAYMLTKNGRVETSNYRTVKLPANMDLPVFLKQGDEFRNFYKAMFAEQAKKEGHRVVFTEYFWDMGWCDPCAADPLSPEELRKAGVFWVGKGADSLQPMPLPGRPGIMPRPMPGGGAQPVMLTRLHVRYTPETFPEDLMFQETGDRQNFQTRYVLRHPAKVEPNACPEAKPYLDGLVKRQEAEAQQLATLTGGDINTIRKSSACRRHRPPSHGGKACGTRLAATGSGNPGPDRRRLFQIGFQAVLLTAGVLLRDFSLLPLQMALALAAAVLTQAVWLRFFRLQRVGYLSPLITGFGLSLLLRADSLWLHPLVAALAISSKFLIRVRGKHVFNPANFGVGLALLVLPGTWVSPGQWGNDLGLGVWLIGLGALVARRASRDDAAFLFLGTFWR